MINLEYQRMLLRDFGLLTIQSLILRTEADHGHNLVLEWARRLSKKEVIILQLVAIFFSFHCTVTIVNNLEKKELIPTNIPGKSC